MLPLASGAGMLVLASGAGILLLALVLECYFKPNVYAQNFFGAN